MSVENPFNQPPQEASEGNKKTMSIEELKATQAKKDAETSEAKRQKEAEEERQKELQARTEADVEPRESALAELKLSQAEIDKLKAERIEERIANSEKLRESQTAKETELQTAQNEFNQIESQLAEIQTLMEGREEQEIAEEVKAAFWQVQEKKSETGRILQGLTQELGTMKAESVSDVQIQRYNELLKKMDDLNAQVADIEANPYMIERLFAEAKAENDMRDKVVREAIGGTWRQPKETEIMTRVVQKFLTEEFEARGLDKIKDPKEREKAMKEFTQAVASQAGGGADHGPMDLARLKQDERVGILLKNLVGKYGTMAGTEGFFGIASRGRKFDGSPQNDVVVGDYIRQHLGTLNFLRANSSGLKTYHEAILGHRFGEHDWKAFDRGMMYKYGLTAYEGSAVVPRDADKEAKDRTQAEFQKNIKEVQDWEKAMVEQEKAQLNTEVAEAEAEVKKLEGLFSEAKTAKDFTEQARRENIYGESEAKRRLEEVSRTVANSESRRAQAEEELNKLGTLAFGKKKELRTEISKIDRELTGYQSKKETKEYLEKLVKAYEAGSPWKVEDELRKAQQKLNTKKNRLADLNKSTR